MGALRLLTWAGLAVLTVGACNCDDPVLSEPPMGPGLCEQDFDCGTGLEYRRGECRPARCLEDADCCPGQICSVSVGLCADQTIACTVDEDCAMRPGQTCIDFRGGQFCGYPNLGNQLSEAGTQRCDGPQDCGPDRACVGQRCVQFAPCGGGCPAGQVCDVDTDLCFEEPSCETTCGDGELLVVADPDLMSGPQCCAVECACAVLPPVQEGQIGWFTDLAADAEQLVASGYDPVYGDLVVGFYTTTGTRARLEYVDGFPLSGPIVGDPTAARGGRSEPGPNVGEHTSVAIDAAGAIHVAYYDRDQGRLKYALGRDGQWAVSVVDEGDNVGLYTSIAIDPDGFARIAYMMAEGTDEPDPTPRTGLKHARATASQPAGPDDWVVQLVDSRPIPPPACGGECPDDLICTDLGLGGTPGCLVTTATVSCGGCGADEFCFPVGGGDAFVCAEEFVEFPSDDLIPGVGLFASLAVTSAGDSVIAYYDSIRTDLKLATSSADETFTVEVLDGRDPSSSRAPGPDVGQHASIAVGPNDTVGIAYFDAARDDLVYLDVTNQSREIVDNGVSPPDLRFVGADADLVFSSSGQPTIAYQDPTLIDLLFARRDGDTWRTEVVRGSTGGLSTGFYASQAHRGSTAFVGGVDVDFTEDGDLRLQLVIIPRPL